MLNKNNKHSTIANAIETMGVTKRWTTPAFLYSLNGMTPLYILLGAATSGRRETLLDLVLNGLPEPTGTTAIFLSEDEEPSPFEESLHALPHAAILNYRIEEEHEINAENPPPDTSTVFFVTDGRANPVDQIEAIKNWMQERETDTEMALELARIITVIHCELGQTHPPLFAWFEACVHFSDIVLLNKRTPGTEKWVQNFRQHFKKHCYPCEFQLIKKGKIENPANALFPQPRRLSLIFDELEDSCTTPNLFEDLPGNWQFDDEEDEEAEADSTFEPENRPDPYLENISNGHRAKQIPDIAEFLDAPGKADQPTSEKDA